MEKLHTVPIFWILCLTKHIPCLLFEIRGFVTDSQVGQLLISNRCIFNWSVHLGGNINCIDKLCSQVCMAYNQGSGQYGNCPDQEACRRLHVCKTFIRGTCDGSTECGRCHDFYEPHPMKTLQNHGVPSQLMASILPAYSNMFMIWCADHRGNITPAPTGAAGIASTVYSFWTKTVDKFDLHLVYYSDQPTLQGTLKGRHTKMFFSMAAIEKKGAIKVKDGFSITCSRWFRTFSRAVYKDEPTYSTNS